MNERLSPNLMVCKSEIVECIIEQMHEMEENISRAKKGDIKVSDGLTAKCVNTVFYGP